MIAHRGNLDRPNPTEENKIEHIRHAIDEGFHVEVDVWVKDGTVWLGHDAPQHQTDIDFLLSISEHLWAHAKNDEALFVLTSHPKIRCFSHQGTNKIKD